jgi:hypothetical protein
MKSQTQYFFHVVLKRTELSSRRIALLGHQTLADLHELDSGSFDRYEDPNCDFRFDSKAGHPETRSYSLSIRLDDLNLNVGQTFEYICDSNGRHERTVEGIDH